MLEAILGVFDSVGQWFSTALTNLLPIFWNATDNELTILGILAVAGLAFSIIFLLVGILQSFLKFR